MPLDLKHQLALLVVAMLMSKGASCVAGASIIRLAATPLALRGVPIEKLSLLVGMTGL